MTKETEKFNVFLGVPSFIRPEGKFEATVGGRHLVRAALAHIEREIRKTAQPVRAFGQTYGGKPCEIWITGVHKQSGGFMTKTGPWIRSYRSAYLWNDEIAAALTELAGRRAAAEEAFAAEETVILSHAETITVENFAELQAAAARKEG